MSIAPILPPFPFPERWHEIDQKQRSTGTTLWLVPRTDIQNKTDLTPTNTDSTTILSNTVDRILHFNIYNQQYAITNNESYEENELEMEEELVLSSEWAARFSKTIKKMKQKVHKARNKAARLNKKKRS